MTDADNGMTAIEVEILRSRLIPHTTTTPFGDGNVVNEKPFSLEPPTLLGSKDFLAVYNNVPLATPDGKSMFMPDCTYELADSNIVSLYSFN